MVFMVAALFILLRFPMVITAQWIPFYPTPIKENDQMYIDLLLASSVCNVLVAFNHSANFVIYIIFLRSFRETCFKLISRNSDRTPGQHVFTVDWGIRTRRLQTHHITSTANNWCFSFRVNTLNELDEKLLLKVHTK